MDSGSCLLCLENCLPPAEDQDLKTPSSLLGRQLKAVFVLRELLRLPPEKLEGFLETSGGDHPHQWINFCDPCQLLMEGAFSLFEQKVRINRKLKKVQQEVVKKVRESQREGGKDAILEETRYFVANHEYGVFEDPFVRGDSAAKWRVEQESVVKVEENVDMEVDPDWGHDVEGDCSSSDDEKRSIKVEIAKTGKKAPRRRRPKREGESRKPKNKIEPGETFSDAHTGKVMYRCLIPHCPSVCSNRTSFYRHKALHQKNPDHPPRGMETWLRCDICQLSCFGHQGLQTHKTKAHPELCEKPFPCAECPRAFTSAAARRSHVAVAHRGRVYSKQKNPRRRRQCPHCPYTTTHNDLLHSHVKQRHEGQRPFTCEHCGKGVSREDVLKKHQAIHHSVCGVKGCGLQLQNKEQLHDHQMTVHGREVDVFRCPQCGELLVGRNCRDSHQELKHPPGEEGGGQQHVCHLCGKGFPIDKYLKYHIKNTHEKAGKKKRE